MQAMLPSNASQASLLSPASLLTAAAQASLLSHPSLAELIAALSPAELASLPIALIVPFQGGATPHQHCKRKSSPPFEAIPAHSVTRIASIHHGFRRS